MEFNQAWKTDERFKKFALRVASDVSLLPEQHGLVADEFTGQLWLLNWQEQRFLTVCDALSDEQFALVLALLERWPSYIPYEELLPHIGIQPSRQDLDDLALVRVSGRANESEEEQAHEAAARTRIAPLLQTLRDVLEGGRSCLRPLGLDIAAVLDHGLLLTRYVEQADEA
jgi:hypothetical protein